MKTKIDETLQKIVIAVSKPLEVPKTIHDHSTNSTFQDLDSVTGKMIFIANKERFIRWKTWMKENDQFHKSGEDMIERCSMMLHEFSHTITLKDKFKQCWFQGEVSGCQLFPEFALDPENKAWNL